MEAANLNAHTREDLESQEGRAGKGVKETVIRVKRTTVLKRQDGRWARRTSGTAEANGSEKGSAKTIPDADLLNKR